MRESFLRPLRDQASDSTTPYSEGAFFLREERSLCLVLRDYAQPSLPFGKSEECDASKKPPGGLSQGLTILMESS